ncbi:MAG TPA: hypothetical protein VMW31_04470 [Devosiaceae bacterium]|nr:hypothetical protein [Devosiaceae bacterium]
MKYRNLLRLIAAVALLGGASAVRAQDADYQDAFAARVANPDDAFVLGQFLSVAVANGQYDQAISTVEQHLINHPRDSKARLIAGRLYFLVGSYELAQRQLALALAIGTLSAGDLADARDLLATVEQRLKGVASSFFITGGISVVRLDYLNGGLCGCDGRTDYNPFKTIGGQVTIDLSTPSSDVVILQGSLGAVRRYGDFDFDGVGEVYIGTSGDFALTLSKGLPGLSPTLRADYTLYGNIEGFDDGIVRREIGIAKRLSIRPSATTFVFGEAALGWLGASTGLSSDYRAHFEAGGTARMENGGTLGVAGRAFFDFDSTFMQLGHTGEIEGSYSSILMNEPDSFVWSHRLSVAGGVVAVPDILSPGDTFDGAYWRAAWNNTVQLQSGNRFNFGVSYQDTRYEFFPERDTAVLAGTLSHTLVLD